MARNSRLVRPTERLLLRTRVVRTAPVSPHFVRVTLGGDDLDRFRPLGYDQWFRLFFPAAGRSDLRAPSSGGRSWYWQYLAIAKAQRPVLRNLTVRGFRPAGAGVAAELDVDLLVHEGGEATRWWRAVEPGGPVALLDEGVMFAPPPQATSYVLVADESGVPAVAGVCRSLPPDARGVAYVEIPDAADAQDFPVPPNLKLVWLPRDDPHARPGALALDAVRAGAADLPDPATAYAFAVGESGLATGVRRFLVTDRGFPKAHVGFCGYWRA